MGYKKRDIVNCYLIENVLLTLKTGGIAVVSSFCVCLGIDLVLSGTYGGVSKQSKFVFLLDVPTACLCLLIFCLIVIALTYVVTGVQVNKIFKRMKNE
ncbi:MAG: hypothetical protein IKX54_05355 [Lachnospiraceae bacterium]|nr:hypothetical protein [Lachnospiraceae bacterium]